MITQDGHKRYIGTYENEFSVWTYTIIEHEDFYRFHSEPMDDRGEFFDYHGHDLEEGLKLAIQHEAHST